MIVLTPTHNFLRSGSPQTNKALVVRDEVKSSHLRAKRKSFPRARRTFAQIGRAIISVDIRQVFIVRDALVGHIRETWLATTYSKVSRFAMERLVVFQIP